MRTDSPTGPWRVRRRWAPRHLRAETIGSRFGRRFRRARERTADAADIDPGCAPDIGEGIVVAIVAIVALVFLIFVGIPFLIALGELLFLLVLTVAGVVGRVLFRRPWTVDAVNDAGEHHTWEVVGWRRSGEAQRYIAIHLGATGAPPSDQEVEAATLAT